MRKKLLPIILLLTTTKLLGGCATNGRATEPQSIADAVQTKPVVIDTACKWVAPIWISKADGLTAGTARQILNHNEAVERNCGPQSPPKSADKP
ncbi:Rz-like spanin [Stenotrophomonas phage vB_SmaS-DLP_2]|uniref:Rz1 n=2 Tax=Septimatrevirus TaxID=1921544 RepID=A0A0M3MXC9_9CAUD|nr:Rz-like spanin [Pseudomonas phage vB_PaeS_SCH_Ab26]YP_009219162.1 Rz-like spanin [Stenotrophomonas phage vB_SmaS-DLP_2]AKI28770.1 Rz1 [Stenotrophomonas phage vB_SmaS-DLP_2]CDN96765.1 Rz1 [Pseudomonas phage vB_PaeS_SCH_Ab26]